MKNGRKAAALLAVVLTLLSFCSFTAADQKAYKMCIRDRLLAQDRLAHADALRRDLDELVVLDELETLLQTEHRRRRELERLVRAGRTGVRNMLLLADVHRDVVGLRADADNHALINLDAGADEEAASVLRIPQAVARRLARLMRHKMRIRERPSLHSQLSDGRRGSRLCNGALAALSLIHI